MSGLAYMCKNRHGTYYARFIIPKQLQQHFNNKKEIRRSLQTDSRKLAIKRARVYRVEFESIVDKLMSKNEYSAYRVTLEGVTVATLPNGEKKIIPAKIERNLTEGEDTTQYKQYLLNQLREEAKREEEKAEILQREKRAEELHQAQLAAITAPSQALAPTRPINSKKLSAYLEDYIEYQTAPGTKDGWKSPDTRRLKTNMLRLFCSDAGDKPAAAFNWDDAKQYIKLAHSIPPNFRNRLHASKFEGVTLEMILDDNIDTSKFKHRKPSAVCNDLKTVRAFLDWTRSEERVKELQDAIDALDSAIRRIDMKSERRNFKPEELKILFEDDNPARENYVKGFNSKRGVDATLKYWLPLLGLYTGATIAELCQLHLSDIRQHKAFDGSEHWVIDMNEEAEKCAIDEDVRFKTDSRPRLIPVHKVLFNLGFIDHVQALKAKGETELFPTSRRSKGEFGPGSFSVESQWWGEYSDNAGITDKNVVFHSFRHTLSDCLSNNHVDRDILAAIDGHAIQAIGKKVYRTGGHREADIGPLVEAFNSKLDYGLKHHPFKIVP